MFTRYYFGVRGVPECSIFLVIQEVVMKRRPVNKSKSASKFRKQVRKTHPANVAKPGRGGYRL